jgi:hypothetical protein
VRRRVDIKPDHIAQLGSEIRVAAELEGPQPMWRQGMRAPDLPYRADSHARGLGHRTGPVRGLTRRIAERAFDEPRDDMIGDCRLAGLAALVAQQPVDPRFINGDATADARFRHAGPAHHLRRAAAFRRGQDNWRPPDILLRLLRSASTASSRSRSPGPSRTSTSLCILEQWHITHAMGVFRIVQTQPTREQMRTPTFTRLLPIDACFVSFLATYSIPIIVAVISLITLLQGFRVSDADYPYLLSMIIDNNISSIPATKGFLLEGILGDLIGIFFILLGFPPPIAMIMWWSAGIILLSLAIVMTVRSECIDVVSVILLLAFSRIVDTLLLWFPKFDSYLIAALILSANRNKAIAVTGVGIAAFLHPHVAIVSTAGVVILRGAVEKIWFVEAIIIALVMAAVDLYLFHYFFPSLENRAQYIGVISMLHELIREGIRWGVVAFISSIVVPFFMMAYFGSLQPISYTYWSSVPLILWTLLVVFLSCFLTFDHTRVSCLLTIAPTIVFLRSLKWRNEQQNHGLIVTFAMFCLTRMVIPHVYGNGIRLVEWEELWHWIRRIV